MSKINTERLSMNVFEFKLSKGIIMGGTNDLFLDNSVSSLSIGACGKYRYSFLRATHKALCVV